IIENWEGNNRAYYCGYLGPVNIGEEINLYVNLRCMEMYGKKLIFHAGCGITEDSESEKEWEETKLKLSTLMRFIHKT
ncbi:MAG: chorismate-binding protein, partial [Chitinophagales bacterium]|nr:chorismate-binding protein [Chitinophagales bacterium]